MGYLNDGLRVLAGHPRAPHDAVRIEVGSSSMIRTNRPNFDRKLKFPCGCQPLRLKASASASAMAPLPTAVTRADGTAAGRVSR